MQKIIREVDEKLGIVQVTIADERWYVKETRDKATDLPVLTYVPSVTWIAGHYPKGIGFYKWLADKGWDESQAIKQAAGDKGSKVHDAISAILRGEEVRIDSKFLNRSTGNEEELTLEECDAIKSFVDWQKATAEDYIIKNITWDLTVFSEKYGYGGTVDYIVQLTPKEDGKNPLKLNGPTTYIIDFKTSAQVWSEYELQVSAYKKPIESGEFQIDGMDVTNIRLAILQIGYSKNKAGYKWNDIDDKFPLFLAARQIWANESMTQEPKKKDYPIVLSPKITVEEAMGIPEGAPEEGTLPLEEKPKKTYKK